MSKTLKYYFYLRVKCMQSHDEIVASGLMGATEADRCLRKLNDIGVPIAEFSASDRNKEISRFFQAALAGEEVAHV